MFVNYKNTILDESIPSANPAGIRLLDSNVDNINWREFLETPASIRLLEPKPGKLNWICLLEYPSIYKPDLEAIAERNRPINTELIERQFHHPRNLDKFAGWGFDDLE
jgi:hypothetical protein